MPDRRAFLSGMLAAGLWSKSTWADVGAPAFLSAARNPDGSHALFGLDTNGGITFEVSLPGRGHAAAAHPLKPQAIAFARRPGRFAVVIDCVHGRVEARLSAPPGRHFYGHGAYSASGEFLFTTENDFEAARGVIGVWDVPSGYARIAEIPSGGVGPHDIKLMPGGKLLAVANGGIETHPDTGRPSNSTFQRCAQTSVLSPWTAGFRRLPNLTIRCSRTRFVTWPWETTVQLLSPCNGKETSARSSRSLEYTVSADQSG